MLTIRAEQFRAFEASATERLIAAAVEHIRISIPEVYDEIGGAQVRESVLQAKRKSEIYGLETWSDLLAYLNVMYILGFDFDEDPRYPWAQDILGSVELSAAEKIQTLLDRAIEECAAADTSSAS